MAEGKKSFVLYADLIHTVDKLSDEQAGKLFKHVLGYVNDEYPEADDPIVEIVFEPIKQQFKRDLKRWESIKSKRSEAGKLGAKIKKQKLANAKSVKQTQAKQAVNVNVNDNVNVNVNDINKFLEWFNLAKEKHTGTKGKFKTLTSTDEKNLKKLRESYGADDFNKAIPNLFSSEWAVETSNTTPSHFLRIENFNKYLNQVGKKSKSAEDLYRQ